jgi:hypothetical protein
MNTKYFHYTLTIKKKTMKIKHQLFVALILLLIGCTAVKSIVVGNKLRPSVKNMFVVSDDIVLYNGKPLAKYQAKTFSLDNNELVEEYNLMLIGEVSNKQVIGDLIDFISDRHQGAEVEIEVNSDKKMFDL